MVPDGQKNGRFPGLVTIVRQETWSAGNAAGKYAGQPLKASCASCAEGLAPLLCALSPTSRVYLSQGLSIRATLFVDRCHNLVLASTEILVFMDKTAQLEPTPLQQTPR